jgi:tRNA wybutosine-synthesizing protein 1
MNLTKVDNPKEIISGCIAEQKRLINGFKGNKKINLEKFKQAQEPMQFAISLTGEPTIYPRLGELIQELRKQGKTSFVVTNGLLPERLKQLQKQKALPTQLYLSLNAPNEKLFNKWHKSKEKQAWKKFNQTLELFPKLLTRKVIRMTLVKDLNMLDNQIKDYTKLIKKANPDFIEVKGYMSVGFARQRLGYETMPTYEDIQDYAKKISKALGKPYKILNSHEFSRVILIGKNKKMMKIQKNKI